MLGQKEKHWVYIIQMGEEGPIKIGVAKDVLERLNSLQTSNPYPLEVIGKIGPFYNKDQAYALEKELHEHGKNFRLMGEWFTYSFLEELLMTINFKPRKQYLLSV